MITGRSEGKSWRHSFFVFKHTGRLYTVLADGYQ